MNKTSFINVNVSNIKKTRIKVLCILQYLPIAGSGHTKEGVYPTILRAHYEAGFEVAVAVHKWGNIEELGNACSKLGVTLIQPRRSINFGVIDKYMRIAHKFAKITWIDWLFFIWRNRNMLAGIDEYIKSKGRPDIIAGFTAIGNTGMSACLIGKRYNIPYVVRENRTYYTRGLIKGKLKSRINDIIKSAAMVFTVSPQLGANMRKYFEVDCNTMVTLQNPVAENFFNKPDAIEWMIDFGKGRFIFAGWTKWRDIKRIDIAIKAFSIVHKKNAKSCLILAGPVSKSAHSLIKKMNLESAVFLTGSLDREGIKSLAHGCDCCIVPSDHDPGNNSILEALAAGKPCIVTKCGGSESRITDASLGRIVEKGDIMGFASAMEDVLINIKTFNSKHIRDECYRLYSIKAFGARLNSAYSYLLKCT